MSKVTEKIDGLLNEKKGKDASEILDKLVITNNKLIGLLNNKDLKKIVPLWQAYRKSVTKAIRNIGF